MREDISLKKIAKGTTDQRVGCLSHNKYPNNTLRKSCCHAALLSIYMSNSNNSNKFYVSITNS